MNIEQTTQAAVQKATSSGMFKMIKNEVCKEQDVPNQKKKSLDITGEILENLIIRLTANNTGENLELIQPGTKLEANNQAGIDSLIMMLEPNVSGKTETDVSICGDSGIDGLSNGIVGILEGFGLLKRSAVQDVPALTAKQLSGNETAIYAGMPELSQLEDFPVEVQTEIEKLVQEYLCSFANTNKSETDTANNTNSNDLASKIQVKLIANKALSMLRIKATMQETCSVSSANTDLKQKEVSLTGTSPKSTVPLMVQTTPLESEPGTETSYLQDTKVVSKDMAENVERLVEKMSIKNLTGKQEYEVTLKPEYLGKVNIKLVMENDGIKAQIKTTNASARLLLGEQIPTLQQMLKDKGINVSQIEVTYENPILDYNNHHSQSQYTSGNGNKNRRFFIASEAGVGCSAYDVLGDISNLLAENSSVEFQA